MITQPLMKDGSTGIKNSPAAMAAMVNDVIEKSNVLKTALGDTRADGEDPSSLRQIGQVLDSLPKYRNAFQVGLWNMVGMILVNNMYWKNDEWVRKTLKGTLEVGDSIEDIWVEVATPEQYDANGASTLTDFKKADILSRFHVLNYQKKYQRTVSRKDFRQAFFSFSGVYDLVMRIVDTMYNGARWDYFLACKYLLARKINDGVMKVATVEDLTNTENIQDFLIQVQSVSNDMEFPDEEMTETGNINSTAKTDQLFIPRNDVQAKVGVKALANAFNLEYAEYRGVELKINKFQFTPTEEKRLAILFENDPGYVPLSETEKTALNSVFAVHLDKDWFFCMNYLFEFYEFEDPSTLKENFFLHDWKVISYSPFRNAVVYTTQSPTITSVTVTPATASVGKGTQLQLSAEVVATGFASKKVSWNVEGATSDKTTITPNGLLVVGSDETATSLTVKAISLADSSKSGSATITVPSV